MTLILSVTDRIHTKTDKVISKMLMLLYFAGNPKIIQLDIYSPINIQSFKEIERKKP